MQNLWGEGWHASCNTGSWNDSNWFKFKTYFSPFTKFSIWNRLGNTMRFGTAVPSSSIPAQHSPNMTLNYNLVHWSTVNMFQGLKLHIFTNFRMPSTNMTMKIVNWVPICIFFTASGTEQLWAMNRQPLAWSGWQNQQHQSIASACLLFNRRVKQCSELSGWHNDLPNIETTNLLHFSSCQQVVM
jgi:hypothetical protein